MSEVPSGSWDSPYLENFASHVGRERHTAGESSGNGGGGGGRDAADADPAEVHGWYTTGMELLAKGSPAAAAQVLQRAANAEPGSRSVREALARAQFDTGDHEAAAEYLALAAAMRPDRKPYTDALRQVRATLRSRRQPPGE